MRGYVKQVLSCFLNVFKAFLLESLNGLTSAALDDADVFVPDREVLSADLALLSAFLQVPLTLLKSPQLVT